jgi:uncharacterized protein (TIGR03437 family)
MADAIPPVVETTEGGVRGTAQDGFLVFKGIPYAAPPVGPRRWLPPDPPAVRSAVLEAQAFGPACPQPPYPGVQATSEDCLTLNIWTPDVSGSHPVLFWMHGGAFVQNWGGNRLTDGAALARRGVVVVTINYRLGVLGIFAHPALSAERPAGPLANFALMDQLAALRWIKKNIPRFGGDPGNVTISGSSAGATSSLFLMTSGASGGLFHKVIAQSGGAREDVIDLAAEEKAGSAFGLTLGVPADASPAAAAALRALPVATITTANGLWEGPSLPPLATKPIVDDRAASTEDDANAIIRGTPNDAFVPGGSILAPAAFLIGSADGESCGRSCPQGALTSIAPRGAFAADLERAAAVAATGARTYVYYFRFVPSRSGESADHGASLPYTFGATISRDPEANRISSLMMDYWVSFMKTGFPAGASGPAWPAYDPREPKSMVFSNADEGGVAVLPIAGAGGSAPPAPASTDVLTVETTIPLPSAPHSLYYNPSENKVYSANPDANSVTVVDGATNQVLATLSLPKGPRAFGHDSHNGRVYTANYYANNLSVIDAKTDRIVATIPSGGAPRDLVYNPVERKIYCANESTDDVTVIDAERMAVIATVAVGKAPRVLSYNPTNSTVYTANSQSSNITVIDGRTDRAIATVSAGRVPKSIVHNPKNRKVYVSNYGGDSVTIIDAATQQVRRTISVGNGPSELFYDAEKNLVYCALIADPGPNRGSDSVVAIDGESDEIVKTIRAEDEPMAFASLSSPHLLFWLNEWSDSISVIDGAAGDVLQVVKVGRQPVDIAANPVRRRLYVGNGLGKSITVLRCISSRYCPQTAEPPVAPRLAGVVNAAGGRAGVIAPNAYYSLFGSNLGSAGGAVSVYDTTGRERLGATVFTSPGQVNFRTPPDQPLGASVIKFIREDGATALLNATTAAVDPGVFAVVFATGPNAGQRPANDRPARVGDILSIYGTGLGPAAGTAIVLFGGVRVVPSYAGDAPGLPGVNQVNFTVPAGAAQGSVPVSLTVGGMASNPVPVIVAGGGAAPYPSGLSEAVMTVDGVVRRYLVHVPAGLVGAPRALVFVLHGGGGEGVGVAQTGAHPLSVFREVADRERFVVVYPEGRTGGDGNPSWNDCRSDNRVGSSADDIAFLSALIDKVRNEYQLPRSRVFMAGGSNGGQMTQSFAAHRPEMVAAIATSSANLPQNPKPGRCTDGVRGPMPALITHGASDPAMPFAGGCVANLGGVCNRGVVISAEETVRRWLEQNGLAEAKPAQSVVDIDSRDAGPANRFYYPGPAPFEWWRLDGAGHTVPSIKVRVPPSAAAGRQNNDIEFAEAAWAFFGSLLPAQ